MAFQDAFKVLNKNMIIIDNTIRALLEYYRNQIDNVVKIIEHKEAALNAKIDSKSHEMNDNKAETITMFD